MAKTNEARAVLRNYHELTERQFVGDTDAICALVDLQTAIERAKLTDKQADALREYYISGYFDDVTRKGDTQTQAARRLGIDQSSLSRRIRNAEERINKTYVMWANKEEGAE